MMIDLSKQIDSSNVYNYDLNGFERNNLETHDKVFIDSVRDADVLTIGNRLVFPTAYAILNGAHVEENYTTRQGGLVGTAPLRSTYSDFDNISSIFQVSATGTVTVGLNPNADWTTIAPRISVHAEDFENLRSDYPHLFKVQKQPRGSYTVTFGEFPQSAVSNVENNLLERIFESGKIKKTGKKYIGKYSQSAGLITYPEYEFEGRRYVRIKSEYDDRSIVIDGKIQKIEKDKNYWVAVEPIKWRVLNWDNLPKYINPLGSEEDLYLEMKADSGLLSGVPYHPSDESGNCLWQNSTVRGILNGINVNNIKKNGSKSMGIYGGGDFSKGNSFLTDAMMIEDTLPVKSTKRTTKSQGKYAVEVEEEPMDVNEQIRFYIEHGKSFMLHGPSGIGKTRRIEEIDPEYVSIVLRNGILPEEVIGKTIYPNNDKTKVGIWVPPAWYEELCNKCKNEPDKNHVLFIDEITNVRPSEQSLVFHLVLNNSIGPNIGKLPENAVVVSAGNSKSESEAAYNMPEPLFRRYDAHIYLKPDIQSWVEWGSEESEERPGYSKVHPIVSAFVSAYGEEVFYSPYDSDNPKDYAIDPRGWEQVSDIIYDNKGKIAKELIENKVGKEISASFMAFAKTPLISLEDVISGNYSNEDIPVSFDSKYALALSLRSVGFEDLPVVRDFIGDRLGSEILATFDNVWVGNDDERAIYVETLSVNSPEQKTVKRKTLFKKKDTYTLSIDDFADIGQKKAIHCDKKWKSDVLCTVMDRMGLKWSTGQSYVNRDVWDTHKNLTCYWNEGMFSDYFYALKEKDLKMYTFEEIDFSKYLSEQEFEKLVKEYGYKKLLPSRSM